MPEVGKVILTKSVQPYLWIIYKKRLANILKILSVISWMRTSVSIWN